MSIRYNPIDLQQVTTYPLRKRKNKVQCTDFGTPCSAGISFKNFIGSLPHILAGNDFWAIVGAIVNAYTHNRPVIFAMGSHVIKCGLSPFVIDLMREGVVSAIAMNGSGPIHDFEIALVGETSEDVAEGLQSGVFGMAEETGRLINEAINNADQSDRGLGEAIGKKIMEINAPFSEYSLLASAVEMNLPATVHVAVGTDIIHMHPSANGKAIGNTSFRDFRLFTSVVADLGQGGVYLNIGSAVILPEVFLKALTIARNLGHDVTDFTTVNLDMQRHYRPMQNVVHRPTLDGSTGYALTGHHEIMIPLIAQTVKEKLQEV